MATSSTGLPDLCLVNFRGHPAHLVSQEAKIIFQREKTVQFLNEEAFAQRENRKQNLLEHLQKLRIEVNKNQKLHNRKIFRRTPDERLFLQVLPIVVPLLSQKDILRCRRVCKQWCSVIETILQNVDLKRQLRQESLSKPGNLTDLLNQFLYRFYFPPRENCTLQNKVLSYGGNPFIGGNVVFVFDAGGENELTTETWVAVNHLLKSCGKHIKSLKLVSGDSSTFFKVPVYGFYNFCNDILYECKNLKHLSISQMEMTYKCKRKYGIGEHYVHEQYQYIQGNGSLEALEISGWYIWEQMLSKILKTYSTQLKLLRLCRWQTEFEKLPWDNLLLLDVPEEKTNNTLKLGATNLTELCLHLRGDIKTEKALRKSLGQALFYKNLKVLQLSFEPKFVGFTSDQIAMGRWKRFNEHQQFCSGSVTTLVLHMSHENNVMSFDFLIYFPHLRRLELNYENFQTAKYESLYVENVVFLNKFIQRRYLSELSIYRSNVWEVLPQLEVLKLRVLNVLTKMFSRHGYNIFKSSDFCLIPESVVTSTTCSESLSDTRSELNLVQVKRDNNNEPQPCSSRFQMNFQTADLPNGEELSSEPEISQEEEMQSDSSESLHSLTFVSEISDEDNESDVSSGMSYQIDENSDDESFEENIFDNAKIREKVLDEFVSENGYLSVTNLLICTKVTDSWLPYVIDKLQNSIRPVFNFLLTSANSVNGRQYVTQHGKLLHQFFQLMKVGSLANIAVPSFCLNLALGFFREENHSDLLKCLSTYGEGLVSLKLNFPVDGGSMMFLFPDRNLSNLKTFAVTITNFRSHVPGTQKVFGNNNNLFFLMQMILSNNISNFELHCNSIKYRNLVPFGFEHLVLPVSVNSVSITFPLEPNNLEIILKSALKNLHRLTLAMPRNEEEVEVVFEILKKCSSTLEYFGLSEAIQNKEQGTNFTKLIRIPAMLKLTALEIPGYPVKLQSQQPSLPISLPVLAELHLGNCQFELFPSYLDRIVFHSVVNLSLSWNSKLENCFQTKITDVVTSISDSFLNLKELSIQVFSSDTEGIQKLFRNLCGLRRLNLKVLKTDDIRNPETWDSILLGIPKELTSALRITKFNDVVFTNDRSGSILNMTELKELTLETEESASEVGTPRLISEVVFYHGFFKMPNLANILLKGRFQVPKANIQEWRQINALI